MDRDDQIGVRIFGTIICAALYGVIGIGGAIDYGHEHKHWFPLMLVVGIPLGLFVIPFLYLRYVQWLNFLTKVFKDE